MTEFMREAEYRRSRAVGAVEADGLISKRGKEADVPLFAACWRSACHLGFWLALASLLWSCATPRSSFEHGIVVQLRGTQSIRDLHIAYGSEQLSFAGPWQPRWGTSFTASMKVPESMAVSWVIGAQHITKVVPLETSRRGAPLRNWRLQIVGDGLEVWRQESAGPATAGSSLEPRREVKVYPREP
jgi:hypothetical protein